MFNQIEKTAALAAGAATITFTSSDNEDRKNRIMPQLPNNFIDIVSLDAVDGSPAQPTAGTYTSYAQLVRDGAWYAIEDSGTINAVNTAGTAMADGTGVRASFVGNPIAIKVIAAAVDVATHVRVTISQNDIV